MDDEMLTIKILVGHCLGGVGHDVYEGSVMVAPRDISIKEAQHLVLKNWARVIPNVREATGPAAVIHGDPLVENGDPVPENRGPVVNAPAGGLPPAPKGRPRAGGR